MKPYILIKCTDQEIEDFESRVSQALEDGYEFSSELITQVLDKGNGQHEIVFIQPMILEDDLDFEEYEEDSV